MPTQQKVLLLSSKQGSFFISTVEVPKPGPGEMLVKVHAAALNPTDWKIQAFGMFIDSYPAILGFDIAGTIEELGENVTGFANGDRVFSQGYWDNRQAAFQQYTIVHADVTARIPHNISFEQAATVPIGLATAALGKPFVVFGGSSSVGQYMIQLAKLAGFSPIIVTASLRNTTILTQFGATHVLDRHLSADNLREEIAKITSLPIDIIYDAITTAETQNAAYDLLAPGGCLVVTIPGADHIDQEKKSRGKGKRIARVFASVGAPENHAMSVGLCNKLAMLLEDGTIQPNHVELLPNGLEGIISGLEKLKSGVSAVKLVARPQETV
ncbi:hypothetical protein AcV7_006193 [Taiwanofungus camphoratus]|nr:hypothetical protein AcV7_006193 [Antrodia cinnamomea]